jgi:sugar O-acyltransferase (sialic acid O-acetyltransferase NeuD family)
MQDLIILGTGSHAHEMADIVGQVNQLKPTWKLLGMLAAADHSELAGKEMWGIPVLGTQADAGSFRQAHFIPEYGSDTSSCAPGTVVNLIAPTAFVARTARLGAGCVIYPNTFIGHNTLLRNRVFVLSGAVINHDNVLDDFVTVCTNVSLAGYVHVEGNCYLGQACNIKQYLTIGQNSLIGMGAVVLHDVLLNSVMVGNPARRLRDRCAPS